MAGDVRPVPDETRFIRTKCRGSDQKYGLPPKLTTKTHTLRTKMIKTSTVSPGHRGRKR